MVVDPRSCLSATSRLWISWVWLLRCDWPARSARDGLSALEVAIGLALESCEDIRSQLAGGNRRPHPGYTGYMGYMGYTGYTGYVQSKGVYGVYA